MDHKMCSLRLGLLGSAQDGVVPSSASPRHFGAVGVSACLLLGQKLIKKSTHLVTNLV